MGGIFRIDPCPGVREPAMVAGYCVQLLCENGIIFFLFSRNSKKTGWEYQTLINVPCPAHCCNRAGNNNELAFTPAGFL
jgi:hypothetical protein